MRYSLWILNLSLLSFLALSELLFLTLHISLPKKKSIEPTDFKIEEKERPFELDLKKIYAYNDLFGTYVPEVPTIAKGVPEEKIPPIPVPPVRIPLKIPVETPTAFIAPLSVALKGIAYLQGDPGNSVAILQFKDSKKEGNYKVGEMIYDAQVLKIFPNRVIVVRSNGQQETLYLREKDAKKDFSFDIERDLELFKIVDVDGELHLPLNLFLKYVKTLGQFIEMLDLTTVYKKGKPVGCRVGKAGNGTFGNKLTFENDDIINKIDGISVNDLQSRVEVYDHLLEKKFGDKIVVDIQRHGSPIKKNFLLINDVENQKGNGKFAMSKETVAEIEERKKKLFEQQAKLAPTAHKIEMDERRKLMNARKKNMLSNRLGGNR